MWRLEGETGWSNVEGWRRETGWSNVEGWRRETGWSNVEVGGGRQVGVMWRLEEGDRLE